MIAESAPAFLVQGQAHSALRLCGLTASTRLLTTRGLVPVETIHPGDRVQVLLGGEARFEPVVWTGRRDIILSRKSRADFPVRIRRHAIADGVPGRDVYLAAGHAIFLNGKLFKVGDLVNGGSILIERSWKSVSYRAIMLQRHNVVLADQLPVETLLPDCAGPFIEVASAPVASPRKDPEAPEAAWDVATEARYVLAELQDRLSLRAIRVEIAMQPDVRASFPRADFKRLLREILDYGMAKAPGRRMLLACSQRGERVSVAMTLDGAPYNAHTVRADIREIEAAAAMLGATIVVDAVPGDYTTIYLKMMPA